MAVVYARMKTETGVSTLGGDVGERYVELCARVKALEAEVQALRNLVLGEGPAARPSPVVVEVLELCALALDVRVSELRGSDRCRRLAEARQVCWWVLSQVNPGWTLKELGDALGKDHTTVIYALRKLDGESGLKDRARGVLRIVRGE